VAIGQNIHDSLFTQHVFNTDLRKHALTHSLLHKQSDDKSKTACTFIFERVYTPE